MIVTTQTRQKEWHQYIRWTRAFIMFTVVILLTGITGYAAAAEEEENSVLEEVLVTATKTGESKLQDTAISISAFTEQNLLDTNTFRLTDLTRYIPNAQFDIDGPVIVGFIRGIGTSDTFVGGEQNVGFYLDGVYLEKGFGARTSFVDVERVEVLRGPQGTLYGRNSTAGAVNIISRSPTDQLDMRFGVEIGNYNKRRFDGTISGPLVADKVKARLTFSDSSHDGYVDNLGPADDLLDEDYSGVRGEIQFTPSENLDIRIAADYMDAEASTMAGKLLTRDGLLGTVFGPIQGIPIDMMVFDDHWTTAHSDDNKETVENWGVSGKLTYNLNDNIDFLSITAYRELDLAWVVDIDATQAELLTSNGGVDISQFSQELQLNGTHGRWNWVSGLYYYHVENDYPDILIEHALIPPGPGQGIVFVSDTETDAWAGFANANYALTDKFSLEAGLRYSYEEKTVNHFQTFAIPLGPPIVLDETNDWDDFSPKLSIQYRITDDALLFGSVSKGFKSGTYAPLNPPGSSISMDPEKVWSYEAGLKSEWLDNRLRLNGTAFYMIYTDMQTETQEGPFVLLTNASEAEIYGFELEMTATPTHGLTLNGSLSYLNAEYSDTLIVADSDGNLIDANGKKLPRSPEWKFVLGAQYRMPVSDLGFITVRGDFSWTDDYYFFPHNDHVQKDYSIVHGIVRFETADGHWSVEAYGKNLTNAKYSSLIGPLFGARDVIAQSTAPRTFGVQVSYEY